MSIETLIAGMLNANHRFAVGGGRAGAPQHLHGEHAAARGRSSRPRATPPPGACSLAGILQALLVGGDAARHGFGLRFRWPVLDAPTKQFLKALGPAIIGAGGVQLALFADTVIATFLPTGALSALYYADRINQLPIGVVGIAIGIVLLPEMSRRLAAGDEAGAAAAQGARDRAHASHRDSLRRGGDRHSRSRHAGAVRARRLHQRRRRGGGGDAFRLRGRALALHVDAEFHRPVSRARRYGNAGEGGAARRRS